MSHHVSERVPSVRTDSETIETMASERYAGRLATGTDLSGWTERQAAREVDVGVDPDAVGVDRFEAYASRLAHSVEWFGWNADTEAEITRLVERNVERVTGPEGQFVGCDAGLDERFYNRYYRIPTPTMEPAGGNVHGADECVETDSLVETAQALALTAVDWCGTVDYRRDSADRVQ